MKHISFTIVALVLGCTLYGQASRQDPGIFVISHLDEKLPSNTNIVYAPAMRAAWTLLKEEIIGEDIRLEKPLSLASALNGAPYDVPENPGWLAMAGFIEDGIIGRINQTLLDRYGSCEHGPGEVNEKDGIVCYATMHAAAGFGQEFETLQWDFRGDEGSIPVECFGVSKGTGAGKAAMREQVRIHDYRHRDDFIVSLSSRDEGKEVILAKVEREGTLLGTLQGINERMSLPGVSKVGENDELVVPKIHFEVDRSFDEILGLHLRNKGFEEYFFARMGQFMEFRLDESGAEATATGEIVLLRGPESRVYIFDKPFLVILRDRNAVEPDLVAWADNAGILVPVD